MKSLIASLLILIVFLLLSCGSDPVADETGTIEGNVYNFNTGEIVGMANVVTIPPSSAVTSDSINGGFKILHVDPGVYKVRAEKVGFDSSSVNISVIAGEKTIADVFLRADTSSSDTTGL